jgi:CHAT domain-containing protein
LNSAPLLSSIQLSNGDTISALDLVEISLDADLVVLSACRTAIGEITNGNDVLGMTRALLASGARSAIVSLWSVGDLSTLLTVKRFYELVREGHTIADALRGTQLWLRRLTGQEAAAIIDSIRKQYPTSDDLLLSFQKEMEKNGAACPFAQPFSWAPFSCIGLAQAVCQL